MRIKKLFKTESEYLDYAWSFMSFDENKVWREEDLPKLKPFFDFDKIHHKIETEDGSFKKYWTPEIDAGYKHYAKCKEEYADELFEIRDSIAQFSTDKLAEFFLLEHIETSCYDTDEDGNDIDEDGNIIPPLSRETIKIAEDWKEEMTFPLYFVGWIDSSWDRFGDVCISLSEFVSLKEFEK
jgi:hypothetical protein